MTVNNLQRKENWLLGSALDFQRDPLAFLLSLATEGGPITRFRLGPKVIYFIKDLDLIHEVNLKQTDVIQRGGDVQKILRRTMGNGILVSDGQPWLVHRRMMQPAFHAKQIANYAELMVRHTEAVLSQLQPDNVYDLRQYLNRLTLGIVSEAMFSTDGASQADLVGETIDALQEGAIGELRSPITLPEWLPVPSRSRNNARSQTLRGIIMELVQARRTSGISKPDLLGMLLSAHDEETGATMTDEQICDEVITIFLAGYDTTALTLSWTFYHLINNPSVEVKLHQELDTVLGGRRPTVDDIRNLPYTEMVIKETLRHTPPAYFQTRHTYADVELGGVKIPQDSAIMFSAYATHHRADLWEEPFAYRPERFADNAEADWHKFKYFPFSYGPHICIGNRFAMMEGVLALATIAQQINIRLADPSHIVKSMPRITLQMSEFPVKVTARL